MGKIKKQSDIKITLFLVLYYFLLGTGIIGFKVNVLFFLNTFGLFLSVVCGVSYLVAYLLKSEPIYDSLLKIKIENQRKMEIKNNSK